MIAKAIANPADGPLMSLVSMLIVQRDLVAQREVDADEAALQRGDHRDAHRLRVPAAHDPQRDLGAGRVRLHELRQVVGLLRARGRRPRRAGRTAAAPWPRGSRAATGFPSRPGSS